MGAGPPQPAARQQALMRPQRLPANAMPTWATAAVRLLPMAAAITSTCPPPRELPHSASLKGFTLPCTPRSCRGRGGGRGRGLS